MKVVWEWEPSEEAAAEPIMIMKVGPEDPPGKSMRSIDFCEKQHGDMTVNASGTRGDSVRNKAIEIFMNSNFNRLFLVDTDQIMQKDTLKRLRGHDLDIVNGLYFRRTFPVKPVAADDTEHWPPLGLLVYPKNALCTIGATGFGCLLIRRQPLQDMRDKVLRKWEPWVWNGPWPERTGHYRSIGSDVRFYQQLIHELGYEIWLDTSVKVGHVTTVIIGEKTYLRQGGARLLRGNYRATVSRRIVEGGVSPMDKDNLRMEMRYWQEQIAVLQKKYEAVRDEMVKAQGSMEAIRRLQDLADKRDNNEELPPDKQEDLLNQEGVEYVE